MSGPRYERFKDDAGEYRWRLVEANGRIVATSGEGYGTPEAVDRAIANVQEGAPSGDVRDSGGEPDPLDLQD